MGVAAARRFKGSSSRAYRAGPRGAVSRGALGTARADIGLVWSQAVVNEPRTLWDRMNDDRELIGLKTVLVASLLLLTAIVEWVI